MDEFLPRHHANLKAFTAKLSSRERVTLLKLMGKLHDGISAGVESELDRKVESDP